MSRADGNPSGSHALPCGPFHFSASTQGIKVVPRQGASAPGVAIRALCCEFPYPFLSSSDNADWDDLPFCNSPHKSPTLHIIWHPSALSVYRHGGDFSSGTAFATLRLFPRSRPFLAEGYSPHNHTAQTASKSRHARHSRALSTSPAFSSARSNSF